MITQDFDPQPQARSLSLLCHQLCSNSVFALGLPLQTMFLSCHYLDQWLHVLLRLHVYICYCLQHAVPSVFFQVRSTILPTQLLHTCILGYVIHVHDHAIDITNYYSSRGFNTYSPEYSIALVYTKQACRLWHRTYKMVNHQIYGMQHCTHTLRVVSASSS